MPGRSLLTVALLLSAGCSARDKASTEREAIAVAYEYSRDIYPGVPREKMHFVAVDKHDTWHVSFNDGGIGGAGVFVDKHSGKVVRAEAYQ